MNKNVWLCGSHHNFYHEASKAHIRNGGGEVPSITDLQAVANMFGWHPLTEELLTGNIMGFGRTVINDPLWLNFNLSALRGMTAVSGFNFFVSFGVTKKGDKMLQSPKREWGEVRIASTGEYVLGFSHDTRMSNAPFTGLISWVEEDWERGDNILEDGLRRWSFPERWAEFFRARIQREATVLRNKHAEFQQKATDNLTRATLIERTLG